jgi:gamma-glutamyltranspeptidase/glutathione hydrolase
VCNSGRRRYWLAIFTAAWAFGAQAQLRPSQPDDPSGLRPQKLAVAKREMVAAGHPLAVEAGLKMLARGGSAADAMVATQLVLNLVEPSSSGLGGGAFLLYYDASAKALRAIDGRETAPAGASAALFVGADGKPMAFAAARRGGRSVGTPGTPRLLEVAHARYGRLPWKALFDPAIALAENGFPISRRLHTQLVNEKDLAQGPAARAYFYQADGSPKPVGTVLKNPQFAATLRAMAARGADAIYRGEIAGDIVAAVRGHANPGTLSHEDLAGYRVRDVEPLCGPYRAWRICGMPPSSSGGIAVLQIMGALERFDLASVRPGSAQAVHLKSEAERLAFADRGRYVADDRFVEVPVQGLVDRAYVASRSRLIAAERSMGKAAPGTPPGSKAAFAHDAWDEAAGTSHIAIVDRFGNALSMTTTIEANFGSRVMARGFLLNNELTDFNFLPAEDGAQVANAVAPGKRPRSSMAPTVVLDRGGRVEMVVGSPGGSLIIGYVAKALLATLDWNLDVQAAIDLPNFGSRNGPTEIERGTPLAAVEAALKAMGHDVRAIDMTSGLQAIRRTAGGWQGGADPRREGVARGN